MATNIKTEPISLNCELCSEMFTDPLMLPCLHSFCKKCLIKVADEQGASDGHLKCPTCDTSVSIPSEGIITWWRETVKHELVEIGGKKSNTEANKTPHFARKPMICALHKDEKLKFFATIVRC